MAETGAGGGISLTEIAHPHGSDKARMDELARYLGDADETAAEIDDGRIQSKVANF